jgi:hypothetical protein
VTQSGGPEHKGRHARIAFLVMALALLVGAGAFLLLRPDDTNGTALRDRQAAVEARGTHVMPFDQATTTHVFAKTEDGGIETVTANDPTDSSQIALIRVHLEHEAQLFASGDFTDPATIHGTSMPGLTELQRGASDIAFAYADHPRGAAITYRTADTRLVAALHAWFDAQIADHGHHAHA